jgi:hypothetical protein
MIQSVPYVAVYVHGYFSIWFKSLPFQLGRTDTTGSWRTTRNSVFLTRPGSSTTVVPSFSSEMTNIRNSSKLKIMLQKGHPPPPPPKITFFPLSPVLKQFFCLIFYPLRWYCSVNFIFPLSFYFFPLLSNFLLHISPKMTSAAIPPPPRGAYSPVFTPLY